MKNALAPDILMHEYRSGDVWGFVWATEYESDEFRYRTSVLRQVVTSGGEIDYVASFRKNDLKDLDVVVRCLDEWFTHSNFYKTFEMLRRVRRLAKRWRSEGLLSR